MKSFDAIIAELRRPFTPDAIQFKIQAVKNKALIVCFIDARQVAERFNGVCPEQWSDHYREIVVNDKLEGLECAITILGSGGKTLTRTDVGISEGGMGGLKAVSSDAFKRAAVKWGCGTPNYYTPRFYCNKSDLDSAGGDKFYMSDKARKLARESYAKWLKDEGISRFGEPLDLGDTTEDQGDIEVPPEPPPTEPTGQTTLSVPAMPRAGKDPQINTLRNAYRDFLNRVDDKDEAKRQFALFIDQHDLPVDLKELTPEQHSLVQDFLTTAGPDD